MAKEATNFSLLLRANSGEWLQLEIDAQGDYQLTCPHGFSFLSILAALRAVLLAVLDQLAILARDAPTKTGKDN